MSVPHVYTEEDIDYWRDKAIEREAELDRLRAENAELRDAFADGECFCSDSGCSDPLPDNCPKLLSEVSRLRAENAELREDLVKSSEDMGRICEENAELREALQQILEWGNNGYAARDIAKAILAKTVKS